MALVSPMMSRKGRPVWRVREALDTLGRVDTGLLRPAGSAEQAAYFIESSKMSPDLGAWLSPEQAALQFPYVQAPFGLVHVLRGYAVDLRTLCLEWIESARACGALVYENEGLDEWSEDHAGVRVVLSSGRVLETRQLILATGPDLIHHPKTKDLNLHPIKGQRIRLQKPPDWHESILPLSGSGFILDEGATLSIGATFEHEWAEDGPTEQGRIELIDQAAKMMPEVRDMEIIEHTAAVRITVPGTRMPMIGPLPSSPRTWVFTGLGSKGILMAGLLGMKIPDFFNDLEAIPPSCRVAYRKAKA